MIRRTITSTRPRNATIVKNVATSDQKKLQPLWWWYQ